MNTVANTVSQSAPANGKEARLREDRRLLGRLLGEVVREQIGAATLELIENIRRSAVSLRRGESPVPSGATTCR